MLMVYRAPRMKYSLSGIGFLGSFCSFERKKEKRAQSIEDTQTLRSGNLYLSFWNSSPSLLSTLMYSWVKSRQLTRDKVRQAAYMPAVPRMSCLVDILKIELLYLSLSYQFTYTQRLYINSLIKSPHYPHSLHVFNHIFHSPNQNLYLA